MKLLREFFELLIPRDPVHIDYRMCGSWAKLRALYNKQGHL